MTWTHVACSTMWNSDTVMRNMTVSDPSRTRQALTTDVGVLDRSVAILDAVEHGARTHAAIVRATGLSRTTAHRLLTSLDAHGLLEYVGGRGYRLGPRLLKLAALSLQEPPLRDVAHPALERLAASTGESAQLYVASIDGRVCIDAVESSERAADIRADRRRAPALGGVGRQGVPRRDAPRSSRAPYPEHAGAHGRDTDRGAAPPPDRHRPPPGMGRQRWRAPGRCGIGECARPSATGATIAAVSISGPTSRIRRADAKRYAPAVMAAARDIERALGYQA